MDELLECALPRLRVRKLHMHKTKIGEGKHHIGRHQRNKNTLFDISLSSLYPLASHHISLQWAVKAPKHRLRLNHQGNVRKIDHQGLS